jgi:hypothetical protein
MAAKLKLKKLTNVMDRKPVHVNLDAIATIEERVWVTTLNGYATAITYGSGYHTLVFESLDQILGLKRTKRIKSASELNELVA